MMATVNFGIDEALKEKSYSILKSKVLHLLISSLVFLSMLLRHKLPVKKALLSEEDEELLALVRKRINDPKEMFEVTLDDL
jgi:RHH-type rel operon transcriptional repressor/antitoxin RelB